MPKRLELSYGYGRDSIYRPVKAPYSTKQRTKNGRI
jgi:hypothetical protein